MSIERSPYHQAPAAQPEAPAADRTPARPREPAPRESVDDFQRLLQGRREQRGGAQLREAEAGKPPLPEGAREAGRDAAATDGAQRDDSAVHARGDALAREDDAAPRRHDDPTQPLSLQQAFDATAFYQAQAMRDGAPVAPPPAPINPSAFADMVERHLKQMAADSGAAGAGDGHVLLRMADATLPGTDLLLSRTAEGWLLRADVRSRSSFDAIREAAPALARRFAERNLGTLDIDPHFHG